MSNSMRRQPHASLDAASRIVKARKIEFLLSQVCHFPGAQVLEIGTGAGFIAAHFVTLVGSDGEVNAVDVVDQRKVHAGFDFELVENTALPFANDSFDICISNHVIEHVGERPEQAHHLREIRRVLRQTGWLYLAVPNRWAVMEPHYRLPFLSWLPRPLRNTYIQIMQRGTKYDCTPLSGTELKVLLSTNGFATRDMGIDALKVVSELEFRPGLRQQLLKHSAFWAKPFRNVLPTFLYLAQPV